jgi:hypothetical protein
MDTEKTTVQLKTSDQEFSDDAMAVMSTLMADETCIAEVRRQELADTTRTRTPSVVGRATIVGNDVFTQPIG